MKLRLGLSLMIVIMITGISLVYFTPKTHAATADDVNVVITPANPAPGETITITLSSYAEDLNSVPISWSENGKKLSSGTGDTSVSLTAPALGAKANVIATLDFPDGEVEKPITIQPSVMVLLWQADSSYVPPFYEGKAMPTGNSEVKVVALPQIKEGSSLVNPNNMTYSWSLDETADDESSGYGKNYFTYVSDYLDAANDVDVTANTTDGNYSTEGSITVATVSPKIDFYKDDPNLGTLWDQALQNGHQIVGNEIIQAAPYFISPADIRIPFLEFDWSINGNEVASSSTSYTKNLFPVGAQAGSSGSSTIELDISNTHDITDTASQQLNVNF